MTERSSPQQPPLADLHVLEIGPGLTIAMAGMVMSDFGAQVVKVEPPGGDPARSSRSFAMISRGKSSVIADPEVEADRARVRALWMGADVVMVSLPKDGAQRLGVDYATVSAERPDVIYCSISGFGPLGPYADYGDYEQLVTMKSGRGSFYMGQAERSGPVFPALPVAGYAAGQGALQGIFAALHERKQSGRGHHVEASLAQGLAAYDLFGWKDAQIRGDQFFQTSTADGRRKQRGGALSYIVGATADGHWLQFTQMGAHLFYRFMEAIGLESLFLEERFMSLPNVPPETHMEVWRIIMERLREKTLDEWMEILLPNDDVTAEQFRSPAWAAEHPQVQHNGDFVEVMDPLHGKVRQLAPLFRAHSTPAAPRFQAAQLGGANGDIQWEAKAKSGKASGGGNGTQKGPLSGITVIEMARYYAAPFGTTLLADLGARVIRVDALEAEQPFGDGASKTTQGKESVALDMKHPRCREILYDLVRKADVFMHNFRPGVTERLGVDYQTLTAINPRLVYLNATAYGTDGPYSRKPAFDPMPGAACGSAWRQSGGYLPTDPATTRNLEMDDLLEISRRTGMANWGFADPASALSVGTALSAGIYFRDVTGTGQELTTMMLRSNMYVNVEEMMLSDGRSSADDKVDPDYFGVGPIYRIYQAGSGSWVLLACKTDEEWRRFCEATEAEALTAERFGTAGGRTRHAAELVSLLEEVFSRKDAEEWERSLMTIEVPCVRADGPPVAVFAVRDQHMLDNGYAVPVEDTTGKYLRHGAIVHVDGPPDWLLGSSLHAEATRKVLEEDLGIPAKEVANLIEEGAAKAAS
jgi:crotonobetainyl-CoA:carnitine CoA-transferase CaiB-like acyl-CoA transferase